jgi:hypothetical protein
MKLITKVQQLLARIPEKEEHISVDALRYWLRREAQSKLDQKGLTELE